MRGCGYRRFLLWLIASQRNGSLSLSQTSSLKYTAKHGCARKRKTTDMYLRMERSELAVAPVYPVHSHCGRRVDLIHLSKAEGAE
jgi:hypothetical protein